MISFLFWNINKKPIQDRVARLASTLNVDVLILAECEVDPATMMAALRTITGRVYSFPASFSTKIKLFTRLPRATVADRYGDPSGELTIRHLNIGGPPGVLLAGVHTPSKMNWKASDQLAWATELVREINREEAQTWQNRTILVGDLNMNPFDSGVVAAQGFHGS